MAWDFETDAEFQEKLDWMDAFVAEKVEPLAYIDLHPADVKSPRYQKLVRPLQAEVKAKGLWACHLGPELGGQGYGQVKLGLMNEVLGRSMFAPQVFGCAAPDRPPPRACARQVQRSPAPRRRASRGGQHAVPVSCC